jgi:hypothetical protein
VAKPVTAPIIAPHGPILVPAATPLKVLPKVESQAPNFLSLLAVALPAALEIPPKIEPPIEIIVPHLEPFQLFVRRLTCPLELPYLR